MKKCFFLLLVAINADLFCENYLNVNKKECFIECIKKLSEDINYYCKSVEPSNKEICYGVQIKNIYDNDLRILNDSINVNSELYNKSIDTMEDADYKKLNLFLVAIYTYFFGYSDLASNLIYFDYKKHNESKNECDNFVVNELEFVDKEVSVKNIKEILPQFFLLDNTRDKINTLYNECYDTNKRKNLNYRKKDVKKRKIK